jgi:hypothetical protein
MPPPLMRANAPLRRLSSASKTAVAFGMIAARRQRGGRRNQHRV